MMPKEMLLAMVAVDRVERGVPGAVVEVIGRDEEAALRLIAVKAVDHVLREYRPIDGRGHQALYAFMNQDPRRPAQGVSVPMLAGAPRLDGSERDLR